MVELKDFQRSTARWAFQRLFGDDNPTNRFLVADEVGLGKTMVAKGVIEQVLAHLKIIGDDRHDIVYICSNASIARQNMAKLVPSGIEVLDTVERLTMLPVTELDEGGGKDAAINLIAISPGTSFSFGRRSGRFSERALVYTFLREIWGDELVNSARARWMFYLGINDGDERLKRESHQFRVKAHQHREGFRAEIDLVDKELVELGRPTLRDQFESLTDDIKFLRYFPDHLNGQRFEILSACRRALATLGINMLKPDLIILDEFQRFKDLMDPSSTDWAATLARRMFTHYDKDTRRHTKTLLLSATPYRMYARQGENYDHFADFLDTCTFLFEDDAEVSALKRDFTSLRLVMTNATISTEASEICSRISTRLRQVMARTERLGVAPDRDGMLKEYEHRLPIVPDDLSAYNCLGDIAEIVGQGEPIEYWKSSPYLFNFMESYQLKEKFKDAINQRDLPPSKNLSAGPGFLDWDRVKRYKILEPQNARLRWLIDDLKSHNAFDLLWIPPTMRYYNSGSVYESEEAQAFTKRLVFSGWTVVPKAVATLTSYEFERNVFTGTSHNKYVAKNRGGGRLTFRKKANRPASMNTFALVWPSVALAQMGECRHFGVLPSLPEVRTEISTRIRNALEPMLKNIDKSETVDQSWYWYAPLLLDNEKFPEVISDWWGREGAESDWGQQEEQSGFAEHSIHAWEILQDEKPPLGAPPDDLVEVLTDYAIGSPAICALRSLSAVTGLELTNPAVLSGAAQISDAFRRFFNGAEQTALVIRDIHIASVTGTTAREGYWHQVLRYCSENHLQAVLDEHMHILRDWCGYGVFNETKTPESAVPIFAKKITESLGSRVSNFGVDIPTQNGTKHELSRESMRTKFAAAFGQRGEDEKTVERNESLVASFNSPFWPFVLVSTSIGQEGLDFHLWSHAVVHWNLPSNPVDLEQREGRVHRYKGHVVRKNIAETLARKLPSDLRGDPWSALFGLAVEKRRSEESEMVPYWVYPYGTTRIERHVPLLPFSRDDAEFPRLKESLAAYRLAFGQPRQEDLVKFLQRHHSEEEINKMISSLRINLTPPTVEQQ